MALSRCEYRVIYGDTDQMGVVYYANYLRFFEKGRCEYLRDRKISYQDVENEGFILPVVDVQCRYRVPARFDDRLEIETEITKVSRIKIDFGYRVLRVDDDGTRTLLAEGSTVHACLDKTLRPVRIPADFVARLQAGAAPGVS